MYSKLEYKVDFDFYDGSKIVLGNIHGMEVQSRPQYLILTTSLDRNSQLAPPPQTMVVTLIIFSCLPPPTDYLQINFS